MSSRCEESCPRLVVLTSLHSVRASVSYPPSAARGPSSSRSGTSLQNDNTKFQCAAFLHQRARFTRSSTRRCSLTVSRAAASALASSAGASSGSAARGAFVHMRQKAPATRARHVEMRNTTPLLATPEGGGREDAARRVHGVLVRRTGRALRRSLCGCGDGGRVCRGSMCSRACARAHACVRALASARAPWMRQPRAARATSNWHVHRRVERERCVRVARWRPERDDVLP